RQRALQPADRRAAANVHAHDARPARRASRALGDFAPRGATHRFPGAQAPRDRDVLLDASDVRVRRLPRTAVRAGAHGERVPEAAVSGIVRGDQIRRDLVLTPDLCVVGSGPGGAIMASRLAEAGAEVVVLEEGGYHTKAEFDMQEATAYPRLYQDRGNRATADLSIAILQGRAVGGGSVVNWTTSFRTPDDVLALWREKEGAELTPAALRPHFEEVEKRLSISKVDLDDVNPNNRALYDGCKKTGRIVRVEPRELVLSCGALNTPALLLRSGLAQGPVGKKTWLHPTIAMVAIYREDIEGFYGAPQSVASHHFAHREPRAGFFMEAAPVHPMLAGLAFPGFGAQLTGQIGLL